MKSYLMMLLFAAAMFTGCSSTQQQDTVTDSTEMDTMKDSTIMDTTTTDSLPADTATRDTI